jgi:thioredoxin reductase
LIARGRELEAVEFADGRRLPFGAMFTATRWSLTSSLAQQLGCEIETGNSGPLVKTDALKESTVPGVYVAGDAVRPGNATLASADGIIAGSEAHKSLIFPKKPS